MKYIRKRGCPHAYRVWCRKVAGTTKADYRELPNSEKHSLLMALLAEQGALCAYTMRRIDRSRSHIEHIKPESLCREDETGSDLDYLNLVACFPREGLRSGYRYGAQNKDNWWDEGGALFVSPLQAVCERRFRFDLDGEIMAVGNHPAAVTTIEVLKLNHSDLKEDRKRVVHEFVYGPGGADPLSQAKGKQAHEMICNRDGHGEFYEFCIAIRDAVEQHMKDLYKRARRAKATRRRRN